MIHPIPPGTRDVLPDEMRELRALQGRLRASFEQAGYGEVRTPALEYEEVLRRGDEATAAAGYRLFDPQGRVLVLRADSTVPIARLVASRYAEAPLPLRLSYFTHAFRPHGESREFLQAGVELIGADAPAGDAEVIALLVASLEEAGLRRHRVAVGDGSLYRRLLDELGVPADARAGVFDCLMRRDLPGLEAQAGSLGLGGEARELLVTLPTLRGGPEVLERAGGVVGSSLAGLRAVYELLADSGAAERVVFDLGLVLELGYYTGTVFEVFDPAVGFAVGGGGRYDDLLGRFGRPLHACGFALDVERVHVAQMEEERLA